MRSLDIFVLKEPPVKIKFMCKFLSAIKHKAVLHLTIGLALIVTMTDITRAEEMPCRPKPPYEAPEYIAPPIKPQISKLHLKDNGDGTITDLDRGLMWSQMDSYADLNKCLTWPESLKYVENLKTAGHIDWRIPTIKELASIYDETQDNVMAWDHNQKYPLSLDKKFADGSAYWYWSSDIGTSEFTKNCAKTLYFVNGLIEFRRLELCNNGGVRAIRNIP
jgi:hypothetical protein